MKVINSCFLIFNSQIKYTLISLIKHVISPYTGKYLKYTKYT